MIQLETVKCRACGKVISVTKPGDKPSARIVCDICYQMTKERENMFEKIEDYKIRNGEGMPPHVMVYLKDGTAKGCSLPEYGEVKITCHAGKVVFVETTVKEKVE